jgi:hypothetical protein
LRLSPQVQGERHRVDLDGPPPSSLVAPAVKFTMVDPAERNREFVADPAAEGARLGEAQVVRIGRHTTAHEARLACDKLAVLLVAQPNAFLEDRSALAVRDRRWRLSGAGLFGFARFQSIVMLGRA